MPETHGIERIFVGWDSPALPSAARLLADRYAQPEELAMGGAVLALPGGRAGRRLKELLLEEAERRELRLVPPRVTTVGQLPELLYQPHPPHGDAALSRRVWARALRALPELTLRLLFPFPPAGSDQRGWTLLAADVGRLHRLVGGAGLRFEDVAAGCRQLGDALSHDDAARWDALAAAQRAYAMELRTLGRSDPELARMEALEHGAVVPAGDLWLVGVAELPAGVRAMIQAAATHAEARVTALIQAPEARAADFDELGCVRPEAWREVEIDIPDAQLRLMDGPAHQARMVLEEITGLAAGYAAEEIVIGAPHEEVIPYLEQSLTTAGLPVRYAGGIALPETGPFRLLSACADYLDGRRFEDFAALLRHSDLADLLVSAGKRGRQPVLRDVDAILVAADRYFSEHLPAVASGSLAGRPAERRDIEAVRDTLDRLLLDRLGAPRRLAQWACPILDLLVAVYGGAPLNRSRPDHRRTLEACQRIRDAAAALNRLPEAVDATCDAGTAIRLLLDEAEAASIPPEPERAAIEILGWLELHLDDAPVALITGVNDPYLPDSINADMFLPNALRSALGLVDNDRRYARDAYQLTAMLQCRERTILVAGRRTASGDPLRPSRLMFAMRGKGLARRVLRFYGDDAETSTAPATAHVAAAADGLASAEAAAPRASAASDLDSTSIAPRFELPPRRVLTRPEPVDELSVTELRLILEDPYRWCLERYYRLLPLDDEARELDPLAFGSLAHVLLQRFARTDEAHATDEAAICRRLDAVLDELAAERYGRRGAALPAVPVQLQQLRARLHSFAGWQASRIAAGWRIAAVEGAPLGADQSTSPLRTGFELDVDDEPMRVVGRIDRIDHHSDLGLWAIFDYKTSERVTEPDRAHRRGRGDKREWVDLQLPMYRHLARAIVGPGGEPLIPTGTPEEQLLLGYICIPRDLGLLDHYIADWSADDLDAADERAREAVRIARSGVYEFRPEAAARHGDGPLAALLGLKQLVAAETNSEDGAEDDS